MAFPLAIAAVALTAMSSVMQGVGANSEARARARADEENARLSLLSGERDAEDIMRDERQMAGDALAAMAGGGLAIGTGSAATVLEESARQRERAIRTRREQAQREDANYRQSAKDERSAGRNALIAGVIGGAAQAISGIDQDRQSARVRAQRDKERRRVMLGATGGL